MSGRVDGHFCTPTLPPPAPGRSARRRGGCQPGGPAQQPAPQKRRPRVHALRCACFHEVAPATQGAAAAAAAAGGHTAAAGAAAAAERLRAGWAGSSCRRGRPRAGGGVQPAEARRLFRGLPVSEAQARVAGLLCWARSSSCCRATSILSLTQPCHAPESQPRHQPPTQIREVRAAGRWCQQGAGQPVGPPPPSLPPSPPCPHLQRNPPPPPLPTPAGRWRSWQACRASTCAPAACATRAPAPQRSASPQRVRTALCSSCGSCGPASLRHTAC